MRAKKSETKASKAKVKIAPKAETTTAPAKTEIPVLVPFAGTDAILTVLQRHSDHYDMVLGQYECLESELGGPNCVDAAIVEITELLK